VEEFWALKDINFEIKQGDRVGIIGRNGAGKSTLLKILSRITEPTTGRIVLNGRVASLLEVGTGFHPELTGRENIYLNGAILGMSRSEVQRKFDEIVEFSGVEKFLDMPVKRYSSGMHVRLAFSVAAHLEPEILIVDEVLAVGDAQFQKKCLGKMESYSKEGRTIIFVSHQMNTIRHLCSRVLVLQQGVLLPESSDIPASIRNYLDERGDASSHWQNPGDEHVHLEFTPNKFWIGDVDGRTIQMPAPNNQDFWVHIQGSIEDEDPNLVLGYAILNDQGEFLYFSTTTDTATESFPVLRGQSVHVKSRIPRNFLNEGKYTIQLWAYLHGNTNIVGCGVFWGPPSIVLNIEGGLSESPFWVGRRQGALAPMLEWITHE
jgi:lipopolysaccharide transport system ATP-binding protein